MTTETLAPSDPLAGAIGAADGWPESTEPNEAPATTAALAHRDAAEVKPKDVLIIDYSGDLEKTWAAMILASTSAAMGVKTRVFVTFWGLQTFVRDDKRITGEN